MIQSPGLLLTIVAFAGMIGPLIFIHEMGHYWAGRLFGVKIDAFSIGFGREIGGWTDRRGTRWRVSWLPLGGYVKFAGDMGATGEPSAEWLALPPAERNRTLQAKPVWQRAIVVAAGPLVNFVAAVVILTGFALVSGDVDGPARIGAFAPASAARAAGIRSGDTITAVAGQRVSAYAELSPIIQPRAGQLLRIDLVRDGRALIVPVQVKGVPALRADGRQVIVGQLGILPAPAPPGEAPLVGLRRTGEIIAIIAGGLEQVVTGERSVRELGGPITIARASGASLAAGWGPWVFLIALVSINLGFINLLPVPMLDGGHLFFYAIEAVRRRPVGPAAQEWAYRGGLVAIVMLMLTVTINDLAAAGVWRRLVGLIG